MDSFNKVISFVLGLVVVLVFFAVVTGKINLKSKTNPTSNTTVSATPIQKNNEGLFGLFKSKTTPTPSPTKKPFTIVTSNTAENNVYGKYNQIPQSIPSTGLPILFLPSLLVGLAGGSFLRKSGK